MNVAEKMKTLAARLGIDAERDTYTGKADAWLTWVYTGESAEVCAGDLPEENVTHLDVHLFTPRTEQAEALKSALCSGLWDLGFLVDSLIDAPNTETQKSHVVASCAIIDET